MIYPKVHATKLEALNLFGRIIAQLSDKTDKKKVKIS
jgi:hypothetical protein